MQAVTVITRRLFLLHLFGPQILQSLRGTETAKCGPLLQQLFDMCLVNVTAFALPIGSVFPTYVGSLVPAQPQPLQ